MTSDTKTRGSLSLSDFVVHSPRGAKLLHVRSLILRPGKLHVVIGPNGAGKSSLLRGMLGIYPDKGRIGFDGNSISRLAAYKRAQDLAYLPQGRARIDGVSAGQFVRAAIGGLGWWQRGRGQEQALIQRALKFFDAEQLAKRRFDSLSGGEALRVQLAATIVQPRPWLLLDEALAAADEAAARGLYRKLRALAHERKCGIVIVEHDLGLAHSFADHLILIADGKLLVEGTPSDVFASEFMYQAYGSEFKAFHAGEDAWAVAAVDSTPGADE